MSYHHRLVSEALKNFDGTSRQTDANGQPRKIYLTPELEKFVQSVKKVHRSALFVPNTSNQTYFSPTGHIICREVFMYFDGDVYAPMILAYGDYSVETGTGSKYIVISRTINNDKFMPGRVQYRMAMSSTLPIALKNVGKYLRPYAPVEIAQISYDDFRDEISSVKRKAQSMVSESAQTIRGHSSLLNELRYLSDTGYVFQDTSLGDAVKKYFGSLGEHKEVIAAPVHAYWVYVTKDYAGEQIAEVIFVTDIQNMYTLNIKSAVNHKRVKLADIDSIDPMLSSKLAVLSMLKDNEFVDGMGSRVTETTYWVIK